jgi:sigma-E factor negative regulatory protein RseB
VPLRRLLYDTSGHEIGDAAFIQVQFGSIALPQPAAEAGAGAAAGAAQSQPAGAWTDAAAPAAFLKSLAAHGWQVPASSPGGLPLYAASSTKSTTGEIVELEYSDGLYDFSLFVQRGTLSAQMSSWPQARLLGRQVYVSGPSVTWARDGFVYTVIADVPPQTVSQLVSGLPNGPPGVVARLGHGFVRLADVINPFD